MNWIILDLISPKWRSEMSEKPINMLIDVCLNINAQINEKPVRKPIDAME
jgi:hypothetical protein